MSLLTIQDPITHKASEKNEIAVGIDFGTTNSLCFYFDGENINTILDVTPSTVHFDANGNVSPKENAKHSIHSIKRLLTSNQQISVGNKKLWAEQIASEVFKKIKTEINKELGNDVKKCVVTVPAYFDDTKRQAIKFAAELAGLEVIRMINEPTAAALYYGIDDREEGLYIVFDLGGGTFDVSILRMQKGVIKVIATGGDANLGGDDFDETIAQKYSISKNAAKFVKEYLSENQSLDVTGLTDTNLSQEELNSLKNLKITKDDFDTAILPLIHKCVEVMQSVLHDAQTSESEIKGLVLVGGSTRMPIIKEALAHEFTVPVFDDADPDRVVAYGAAVQAYNLTSKSSGNLLLDVIPLSLGIETLGGAVQKVIERNTSIPIEKTVKFTTFEDYQTGILINVVQGERDLAKDCRSLAKFELTNITPQKAGIIKVNIKFHVDENSILSVSAWEEDGTAKNEIEVKPTYGIASEEIRSMLVDAIKNAQTDIEAKLTADAIIDAKNTIKLVEDALKDSDLANTEELDAIKTVLKNLHDAIQKQNRHQVDALTKQLDATAQEFVERRTAWYLNQYTAGKKVDEI